MAVARETGYRFRTERTPALDPIALFAAAREADVEAALFVQPAAGLALVGVGRAWAVEPAGPDRFRIAGDAWRALVAASGGADEGAPRGAGPVLLGGLGFTGATPPADDPWAPFGAASLVLPELAFAAGPDGAWVTAAVADDDPAAARRLDRRWDRLAAAAEAAAPARGAIVARPVDAPLAAVASRPDRAAWDRLVGMFAGAVGRGRLDKVVLARRVGYRSPVVLDVENALRRLAAGAPESTIYAFSRGASTFVGATPERLVRTEGRAFETVALAGSAPRGRDAEEDARLAAGLLVSEKDREEHAVVVSTIRAGLGPLAERLEIGATPEILALRTVQHLRTPIRGRLRADVGPAGLLALAAVLHPTPAVGGEPRGPALEMIAEHEGWERGWYAGPIGWLGADGDGELMVALRCGIVAGQDATLFAGCGIVADSDPAAEWEESRLKLRALASALGREEEPR